MREIVFELCAENIDACLVARDGGADRIELCSALSEGGLTPSHGLVREAVNRSGLPVHVLLRPRGGDFVYSDAELDVMREDLKHLRLLGASGVVLGVLREDCSVDVKRTRELVEMADTLEVTFNRAFDHTASLEDALEDVIATGCQRVLTSGGERDVVSGGKALARLIEQAAGRIEIAAGGGLRLKNAAAVARITGARHFHGSIRKIVTGPCRSSRDVHDESDPSAHSRFVVESDDVRAMIENLTNA
ncbi:copper homeostasis protein CutC [Edaphobacter dinghuensis]|uniref:copper homeostasis protein CutC n=1 Tax=Edaphobacter dinghuensis TaxID=1560005 RepID=UPI00166BD11B|nr:copper homeostasis protein CutC [Edaphobacter dinghuensis]